MRSRETWVLGTAGIVLAAWTMRVFALDALPPGTDRDAATNGVYALTILYEGLRPLFYRVGAPEPLIIYLQSASVALLGANIFALRLVTAIIGALTIPALYVFVRALQVDRRLAFVSAFGLAFCVEHAHLSRLGLRAIMIPLFEMGLLYFFWRGWRSGRARDFAFAGVVLGVGYYTYLSALFLPILLATLIAYLFIFQRALARARWRGIALTFAIGGVIAAPLGVFEMVYPGAAFFRASQVTLLQHPAYSQVGLLGVIALKLISQFQMLGWVWQGQYNPLAQPLLDPIWFTFLLIGIVVCARQWRRIEMAWALIAIGVMLLPDLIGGNEIFPQELRVIGIIPPVFFVAAVGFSALFDFAKRWYKHAAFFIGIGLLSASAFNSGFTYLVQWNRAAQITDDANFNRAEVTEGEWLARQTQSVFVPLNEFARQPVRFLAGQRAPYISAVEHLDPWLDEPAWVMFPVDPSRFRFEGRAYVNDPAMFVLLRGNTVYLLPALRAEVAANLEARLRANVPAQEIRDTLGQTVARAFAITPRQYLAFAASAPKNVVRLSNPISLVGSSLDATRVQPGGALAVSLEWQTARRLSDDYMIFVHLLDVNGNVASGLDVIPGLGVYSTMLWKPGETISTHHILAVPARTPPGKYLIEIGLYNVLDQNRLDVLDANGKPVDSRVIVGAVKVAAQKSAVYDPPLRQTANFDQEILLEGYALPLTPIHPGDSVPMTLAWRGLAELDRDYSVFVHVLDPRGHIVAQADHQPQNGADPTSIWDVGEQVQDNLMLTLPTDLPAGTYQIELGWYDLKTNARLNLRDDQGQISGDHLVLQTTLEVAR